MIVEVIVFVVVAISKVCVLVGTFDDKSWRQASHDELPPDGSANNDEELCDIDLQALRLGWRLSHGDEDMEHFRLDHHGGK